MSDLDATDADMALDAFVSHCDQIEDELDGDLTPEMREAILQSGYANGFTQAATEHAAAYVVAGQLGIDLDDAVHDDLPDATVAPSETAGAARDHAIDLDQLQRDVGRELLRGEQKAVSQAWADYVDEFGAQPGTDFAMEALRQHHNGDLPDKSTTEGRTWLASERLREAEQPDAEDDDSLDELDFDKREDRLRYGVAKHMQGIEFEEDAVDEDGQPDDNPDLAEAA